MQKSMLQKNVYAALTFILRDHGKDSRTLHIMSGIPKNALSDVLYNVLRYATFYCVI